MTPTTHASAPAGADLIVHGARISTLDPRRPHATALAVGQGRVLAVGGDADVLPLRSAATRTIDAAAAPSCRGSTTRTRTSSEAG
jgi:predicted amidohydrolase YtcJ